jgi:hypothetical protein
MLAVRLVDFEECPDTALDEPETMTHWRNLGWSCSLAGQVSECFFGE